MGAHSPSWPNGLVIIIYGGLVELRRTKLGLVVRRGISDSVLFGHHIAAVMEY